MNIQNDLNKLIGWADKWQMDFNSKKCKVLHLGYSNKEFSYEWGLTSVFGPGKRFGSGYKQ